VDLLSAAETELENESEGPWDVKDLVEREVTFWEAELNFKHRVEKDFKFEKETFRTRMPVNRLRAGLCALFFAFVLELADKEGRVSFSAESLPEGVCLRIKVSPEVISPEAPFLKAAAEVLSPEAELTIYPGEVKLLFKRNAS